MRLRMKWYAAAVVATMVVLAATASRSQESSETSDVEVQQEQLRPQQIDLEKSIEKQVFAAHEAAQRVEEAAQKAEERARFKFRRAFPGGFHFAGASSEVVLAAEKVRDATDETAKAKAIDQLRKVVDQCFEDDMQQRAKELEEIQQRLERLKAQLDRRHSKREEIVDLQVKVAINDAEGLGFYSQPTTQFDFQVSPPTWITTPDVPAAMPFPAPAPIAPVPPAKPAPSTDAAEPL